MFIESNHLLPVCVCVCHVFWMAYQSLLGWHTLLRNSWPCLSSVPPTEPVGRSEKQLGELQPSTKQKKKKKHVPQWSSNGTTYFDLSSQNWEMWLTCPPVWTRDSLCSGWYLQGLSVTVQKLCLSVFVSVGVIGSHVVSICGPVMNCWPMPRVH